MTAQQTPFARKLGAFSLSGVEMSAINGPHRRRRAFPAGRDMGHQGQRSSYKLLSGGARQIVDFQIPGDFLGLRSVLFRTADHNIEPVTKVEASGVSVEFLLDTFTKTPCLATAVLWAASRDEAMVVEHLVGIGRRDARERTAHFLLEPGARLKLVGLGSTAGYDCPLSQ